VQYIVFKTSVEIVQQGCTNSRR